MTTDSAAAPSCPSPAEAARTEATCKTCQRLLPIGDFYGSIRRSFYFCKSCCSRAAKLRRTQDPATRLLSRARASERRRGVHLRGLKVDTLRLMLADLGEPDLIKADRLRLVRCRAKEPLGPQNAQLLILAAPDEELEEDAACAAPDGGGGRQPGGDEQGSVAA